MSTPNGLTFDGEVVGVRRVDLDDIYEIEIVLRAMNPPRRIMDSKVPLEVYHPREAIKFSNYFKRKYRALRDPYYAKKRRSEVEYALVQLGFLQETISSQTEVNYNEYMASFERSVENAGARLADSEIEAEDRISKMNESWDQELKILDERARGYRRTGTKVVAAVAGAASVYFASYKGLSLDPLLSTAAAAASTFVVVPLVDRWYEGKKSRINRRFAADARVVDEHIRRKKVAVHVQTLAEVTNNLGRYIPDTLLTGRAALAAA